MAYVRRENSIFPDIPKTINTYSPFENKKVGEIIHIFCQSHTGQGLFQLPVYQQKQIYRHIEVQMKEHGINEDKLAKFLGHIDHAKSLARAIDVATFYVYASILDLNKGTIKIGFNSKH